MRKLRLFCIRSAASLLFAVGVVGLGPVGMVSAAPSPKVREAQSILAKFSFPVGRVDGYYGPNTARALCAYRVMIGQPASRSNVSASLLQSLRTHNARYARLQDIPARSLDGRSTYVLADKHCQAMFYVEGRRTKAVIPISTGKSGKETPNGVYSLGYTQRGWSCSTLYPESCPRQTTGRFATANSKGNMYNKRFFRNTGYFIHGSTHVPTYPASMGCIRVPVKWSDWMYSHVGNNGKPYFRVVGNY